MLTYKMWLETGRRNGNGSAFGGKAGKGNGKGKGPASGGKGDSEAGPASGGKGDSEAPMWSRFGKRNFESHSPHS